MHPAWPHATNISLHVHLPQSCSWVVSLLLCRAKLGRGPDPAPVWVGNIIARILRAVGPTGLEFGRYSIDYHYIRNFLYVKRHWAPNKGEAHMPEFARRLVSMYDGDGAVSKRYSPPVLCPDAARFLIAELQCVGSGGLVFQATLKLS